MEILLTRPVKLPSSEGVGAFNDNGLGYVASACTQAGAEVKLLSWNVPLDEQAFCRILREFHPKVIGVKVFTPWFREARATLELVRRELPEAITIIGGPHPSASRPEDIFKEFDGLIDAAVAGDGELAMAALLAKLSDNGGMPHADQLGDVPALSYRDGAHVKSNPRCFDVPLDELPRIDWNVQQPRSFAGKLYSGGNGNSAMVSDSRGCPGRCWHCMAWMINGGKVRQLSVEGLCSTLRQLIEEYGVRSLDFTGNCFLADKQYVYEVCRWLIERSSPVLWGCTGAEFIDALRDRELVGTMARAGCKTVHFGIESGNEEIVKQLRKPFTLQQCGEAVRITSEAGIDAVGYFMFGFPDETLAQMNDTIEYSMSLPFSRREFCICLPLPGTSSYRAILAKHGIDRIDWNKYDFANPSLLPSAVSARQVRRVLRKARELQMDPLARWQSRVQRFKSDIGRLKNQLLGGGAVRKPLIMKRTND